MLSPADFFSFGSMFCQWRNQGIAPNAGTSASLWGLETESSYTNDFQQFCWGCIISEEISFLIHEPCTPSSNTWFWASCGVCPALVPRPNRESPSHHTVTAARAPITRLYHFMFLFPAAFHTFSLHKWSNKQMHYGYKKNHEESDVV